MADAAHSDPVRKPTGQVPADGRHARRERSRAAVIDAVFALIQDGRVPPTAEDIAERAGVSVSSVFRNFDGLDDLQRQAFDRFQDRFAHLFDAHVDQDADRSTRIRDHVRSRIELCTSAGKLMHVARQRAIDYQPMADGVARSRSRLAAQTHRRFAPETEQLGPADTANLVALIDATTSPEAFEVMRAAHGRSARQISAVWTTALDVLLAGRPAICR
jgi:TetR/AcrR family transcriptional regulator of autoinduction and epiphytic fitness